MMLCGLAVFGLWEASKLLEAGTKQFESVGVGVVLSAVEW